MSIFDKVLASSGLYDLSRRMIGAHKEMERMVALAGPAPGDRVLDFGCGNGRLVPFLRDVEYIGVDNNPSYIADATEKHGSPRHTFVCGDLLHLGDLDLPPVDHVLSIGVLHHLDDDVAEAAVHSALAALAPGGQLTTMDPCFEPSQSSIARVLMALDRGRFVRHPADYRRLVERAGGVVEESHIWDDIFRFPYTHYVQVVRPGS